MKHFLISLLFFSSALWANYPEDVYFFELNPAVWEYFASPDGDKISVYRTLSIEDEVFFLNMQVQAFVAKKEFTYSLAFRLDAEGAVALYSFSDNRSKAFFPQAPLFFPSGGGAGKPLRQLLAKDISWEMGEIPEAAYRNPLVDVPCRLWLGSRPIELSLRYQQGISGLKIGGLSFAPVTRRVFNSIK